MEPKKNPEHDLHRKSPMFFTLGLAIAILIVTLAFEWKSQYQLIDLGEPVDPWEEAYIVPNTAFPIPKPPKATPAEIKKTSNQPPVFVETKEIIEIAEKLNPPTESPDFDKLIVIENPPIEVIIPDEPFDIVESMPSFPGGTSAFNKYVSDNLNYPRKASRMGITGRVFVRFVIDEDGSLTNVKAIKGIGAGCDEEAVRVIEGSPKWIPGKQRGRKVKVRMVLPIQFSLR